MTIRVSTMPAPGGGYYGLVWSEKYRGWIKVKPINGGTFEHARDAIRAAKYEPGNPFNMTAACPLPEPDPDFEALGINKWRRRKAEEVAKLQLETFGKITVKGRSVAVERKRRRNGERA